MVQGGVLGRRPGVGYERRCHETLDGDRTLFGRGDSVDGAWQVVQPILADPPAIPPYLAGTWGPAAAEDLIAPRLWHLR